jgi:Uma2 family endonuclease
MSPTKTVQRHTSARAQSPHVPGEERQVMPDATWDFYDRLTDALGEHSPFRVAFDGKDIEIMTVGNRHERIKSLTGQFVDLVIDELAVDCVALGSTTWKRPELERGLEADQSYAFDPAKIAIFRSDLVRDSNDLADCPDPDLAIEIDISPSRIDRPGIYAALRVAEVWRHHEGRTITIEQLGDDGQYVFANSSRFLHVRPEEVMYWLDIGASTERAEWRRRVKEWIATDLKPRIEAS